MKTLIAYSTTHGCTEKTAKEIKHYLGDTTLVNLKKDAKPDLLQFERVIIGGSIHAGQIQKRVKTFCQNNMENLQSKELGLFICCMEKGETAQKQLRDAFPDELHSSAKVSTYFGGEFDFERMNFLERMIVKKVAHVESSTSEFDAEAVKSFAKKMDKVFNPFLFLL